MSFTITCGRHNDCDVGDELRRDDNDFRLLRHLGVVVGRLQDVEPRDVHGHRVQVLHHHPVVDLDGVGQVETLGGDFGDSFFKVEHVDGELVRVRANGNSKKK